MTYNLRSRTAKRSYKEMEKGHDPTPTKEDSLPQEKKIKVTKQKQKTNSTSAQAPTPATDQSESLTTEFSTSIKSEPESKAKEKLTTAKRTKKTKVDDARSVFVRPREDLLVKLPEDCLREVLAFLGSFDILKTVPWLNHRFLNFMHQSEQFMEQILRDVFPQQNSIENLKDSYGMVDSHFQALRKAIEFGCYGCGTNLTLEAHVPFPVVAAPVVTLPNETSNSESLVKKESSDKIIPPQAEADKQEVKQENTSSKKKRKARRKKKQAPPPSPPSPPQVETWKPKRVKSVLSSYKCLLSSRSVEYKGPTTIRFCPDCSKSGKCIVTKTIAKSMGLSETEVMQLPHYHRRNPHYAHAAPMVLFSVLNVQRLVTKKTYLRSLKQKKPNHSSTSKNPSKKEQPSESSSQ